MQNIIDCLTHTTMEIYLTRRLARPQLQQTKTSSSSLFACSLSCHGIDRFRYVTLGAHRAQRSPLPGVHTTEGKTGSNFGGGSGNETR